MGAVRALHYEGDYLNLILSLEQMASQLTSSSSAPSSQQADSVLPVPSSSSAATASQPAPEAPPEGVQVPVFAQVLSLIATLLQGDGSESRLAPPQASPSAGAGDTAVASFAPPAVAVSDYEPSGLIPNFGCGTARSRSRTLVRYRWQSTCSALALRANRLSIRPSGSEVQRYRCSE